jgi:hypothetical protein
VGALHAIVSDQLSFAVFEDLRRIDVTSLRVEVCSPIE